MQRIVAGVSYRFIPPYRGRFLAGLIPSVFPAFLRLEAGIKSIEFYGEERLRKSLLEKRRIVLASNHSRFSDPMLLAILSRKLNQPFYYMTNWHAFLENRAQSWLIRRLGGFSIFREGADRTALSAAREILIRGDRPLVIFPEGEVSRTNDYLCQFMRGFPFIVKIASRALAGKGDPASIIIHPVAIRYRLLNDIGGSLHAVVDQLENARGWPRSKFSLLSRIAAVGKRLLAQKELELFGGVQSGEIYSRAHRLKEFILSELEKKWLSGKIKECFMSRVNRLRGAVLKEILAEESKSGAEGSLHGDLKKIEMAVRLSNYPDHYLRKNPTLEKMAETVQSLEEDLLGRTRYRGRWKAEVRIGDGTFITPQSPYWEISEEIRTQMRGMLETLRSA